MGNPNTLTERVCKRVSEKTGLHRTALRPVVRAVWDALKEEYILTGKLDIPGLVRITVAIRKGFMGFFRFREDPYKWVQPRPYARVKAYKSLTEKLVAQRDMDSESWKKYQADWQAGLDAEAAKKARKAARIAAWREANPNPAPWAERRAEFQEKRKAQKAAALAAAGVGTTPAPAHTE